MGAALLQQLWGKTRAAQKMGCRPANQGGAVEWQAAVPWHATCQRRPGLGNAGHLKLLCHKEPRPHPTPSDFCSRWTEDPFDLNSQRLEKKYHFPSLNIDRIVNNSKILL